ncbi:MAG TPA: hypothetical protein VGF72_09595 [Gaiellaceae bacterium]|jgi:hypothetical protein
MRFDWKSLSTLDRAIVAGAAVAFIALFLPWWGVGFIGFSVDGWGAGFTAWAGGLLLTAAGVLLVLRRSGATMSFGGAGPSVVTAGVAALGLLLVIIRWASLPSYRGSGVGAKYGLYIALIAGIVEVAAAVMAMRASGEQLPWAQAQHGTSPAETTPEAPAAPEE